MKKILSVLFILSFALVSAHQNVIFRQLYGKVNLCSSTSYYTEEVNKNIITAKYVDLLLKELNYEQIIHLRLTQERDFKCYVFFEKEITENKGLNIMIFNKETDISKTLNLIENIIVNLKSIDKDKEKFSVWYNSDSSKLAEKVILNKINRPYDVPQLQSNSDKNYYFDYYYENGIYHILSHQNREVKEVAQMDQILQFSVPTYSQLFVFDKINSLTVISSYYKYNFDEKKYYITSETINFEFEPEWNYSFRPYTLRLLGKKYVTIESVWGDKIFLYTIDKKKLIQDLSSKIED